MASMVFWVGEFLVRYPDAALGKGPEDHIRVFIDGQHDNYRNAGSLMPELADGVDAV